MRISHFVLSSVIAAIATASESDTDLFAYDKSVPFAVHESGGETRGAATIRDLTFIGADTPVKGYLITPTAPGPHAAVLCVHWLGEPGTTNRSEFLDEAVVLAERGTVSLLVDAMWAEPQWYKKRIPEDDRRRSVRQVIELRRAMDLLLSQPSVDPQRVALVAHDFGAMYGLIACAQDQRVRTFIIMAAVPHFIDWFLFARQPQDLDAYRREIAPLDPVNFVRHLAPASVFFQFANRDKFVSADQAAEFFAAARPRKQMTVYESGHELHTDADTADRLAWLERELDLKR